MTTHTARTAGAERAESARSAPAGQGAAVTAVAGQDELTGTGPAPMDLGDLPWIEDAGKVAPTDARELSRLFFDRLQVLEEGTAAHQYARNTLIEMNLSSSGSPPAGSGTGAAATWRTSSRSAPSG